MKEKVIGVLAYPYDNYLLVTVARSSGFGGTHNRAYTAFYGNSDKVLKLMNNFINLNSLLQHRLVYEKIWRWRKLNVQNN